MGANVLDHEKLEADGAVVPDSAEGIFSTADPTIDIAIRLEGHGVGGSLVDAASKVHAVTLDFDHHKGGSVNRVTKVRSSPQLCAVRDVQLRDVAPAISGTNLFPADDYSLSG